MIEFLFLFLRTSDMNFYIMLHSSLFFLKKKYILSVYLQGTHLLLSGQGK